MISEREYEKWSLSVLIKNFPNVDINILQAIQEYALHKKLYRNSTKTESEDKQ